MISALTVLGLILPFPIVFLIHKSEELATQHKWFLSHREKLIHTFPKRARLINHLSELNTKAHAVAVIEELVVILLATGYVLVEGPYAIYLWAAVFMAFFIHQILHVIEAITLKGYVPGLVTGLIAFPYTILGVSQIARAFAFPILLLCTLCGLLVLAINLYFAHWLGLKLFKSRS